MADNLPMTVQKANAVSVLLEKNRDAMVRSLPGGAYNFDRMMRSVVNAVATTPSIAECTKDSIFLAVVRAFTLGLEPNSPLQQGYLIPYNSTRTGRNGKYTVKEAQFMPSYRGLLELARRSGGLTIINAVAVHEKDRFSVERGTSPAIVHSPDPFGDRGEVVGYYAVYWTADGQFDFEAMSLDEVHAIRNRNPYWKKGPWASDPDEMGKKTVLKRLLKRAPVAVEVAPILARAIEADHRVSMGEPAVVDPQELVPGLDMSEDASAASEGAQGADTATDPGTPTNEPGGKSDAPDGQDAAPVGDAPVWKCSACAWRGLEKNATSDLEGRVCCPKCKSECSLVKKAGG